MGDVMRPIPFDALMEWILTEYEQGKTLFGVDKLYKARPGRALELFGEKLETPFGPAAGPHTQLAQNIITAYGAGSRFFELKTVQVMDGAALSACVGKPCIAAGDECYNCEWSTELTVQQAFEEYVKAWFALKLLSKELELGSGDGFIFNMSVGYDLAGIQSEKIDAFIEGLRDAGQTPIWQECTQWALQNVRRFRRVNEAYIRAISPHVCRSITLSTLHGCPPEEIEKIAVYLLEEKGLHTFVKCNPTLLGYDFARETLDSLGYDYMVFDDHHFKGDLQYTDAVPMLQRLQALAAEKGLTFGVKLTNTFPVTVAAGELPAEEMYMSGRSLFPLTTALAEKLSREFNGKLRISYSGGADALTVGDLFAAGIWPITMATTILKPGGYARFHQMGDIIGAQPYGPFTGVDVEKLGAIAARGRTDARYRKPIKPMPSRKNGKKVPLLDCFLAPCRGGCPIEQDIPGYLRLYGEGKPLEALRLITNRNPLPFITGTICNHRCMDRCTRFHYEESVDIRGVKLASAREGYEALLPELKPAAPNGKRVAVVGGGPAGLSAAFFLARAGCAVTVFEKSGVLGGIVRRVIPPFRISDGDIEKDISLCRAMGVTFAVNHPITSRGELDGFDAAVICTGAWIPGKLALEYGEAQNVIAFLEAFKSDPASVHLGKNVVIVGGGNTAMDAARAALQVPGVEQVSLVYRRDKRNMPADEEELVHAEADGVIFRPLLSPIGVRDGVLTCQVMELGAPDASGRRSPVATDKTEFVPADTVIAAIGERTDSALYAALGIEMDSRGRAKVDEKTGASSVPGIYLAGDAASGPSTVVQAIAGATRASRAIADWNPDVGVGENVDAMDFSARFKRGQLVADCASCAQSYRCLECPTVCELCLEVCPNRANVRVMVDGKPQILHIDGMCNECGNCAVFCPYDSAPYREKLTLFWTEADFAESENFGFLPLDGGKVRYRLPSGAGEVAPEALPDGVGALAAAVLTRYTHLLPEAVRK